MEQTGQNGHDPEVGGDGGRHRSAFGDAVTTLSRQLAELILLFSATRIRLDELTVRVEALEGRLGRAERVTVQLVERSVELIDRVTELERQLAVVPDIVERVMTTHDAALIAQVERLVDVPELVDRIAALEAKQPYREVTHMVQRVTSIIISPPITEAERERLLAELRRRYPDREIS